MARWKFAYEAINPKDTESLWEVGIAEHRYRLIVNKGHEKAHARIVLVQQVLANPLMLFAGWSRPEKEDCCVYVGRPKDDYHRIEPLIQVPAPPQTPFFCVFVLPGGEIDEWTWRARSDNDVNTPHSINGELVWQAN